VVGCDEPLFDFGFLGGRVLLGELDHGRKQLCGKDAYIGALEDGRGDLDRVTVEIFCLRIRFRDQAFDTCVQRCHGRESAPVWSWLGANELKRSRAQYNTVWWKRRPQEQGQRAKLLQLGECVSQCWDSHPHVWLRVWSEFQMGQFGPRI
jgi:hypothetical protein